MAVDFFCHCGLADDPGWGSEMAPLQTNCSPDIYYSLHPSTPVDSELRKLLWG